MRWIALLSIIGPTLLVAQSIPLNGVITVHNSAYRTGKTIHVRDAAVRAAQAKPVSSDIDGRFALDVIGMEPGASVQLSIEHDKLVVLDPRPLEHVVLGASEPLVIRMADPKELAEERIKFHGIAEVAIESRYKERMERLQDSTVALRIRLNETVEEFGGDSVDLADAITKLVEQRQAVLEGIDELTERFVLADMDMASDRYRRAFELFSYGKLDEALHILDEQELHREQGAAVQQRTSGEEMISDANAAIRELRSCYRLKKDVLQATMRPMDGHRVMLSELALLKQNPDIFPPSELVRSLSDIGSSENFLGLHDLAQLHLSEALRVPWIQMPAGKADRLTAMLRSVEVHDLLGQADSVLFALEGFIRLANAMDPPAWGELGAMHYYVGRTMLLNQQLDEAYAHLDTARILVQRDSATSFGYMPGILESMGWARLGQFNVTEAAQLVEDAIEMEGKLSPPNERNIAISHGNLAGVLWSAKQKAPALEHARKSVFTLRRAYGYEHPDVYRSEAVLALCMQGVGMADSALTYIDHCLAGMVDWYDGDHYQIAVYVQNRADVLKSLGRYAEAIDGYRKAISFWTGSEEFDHVARGRTLGEIGYTYLLMGRLDSALINLDRGLDTLSAVHGSLDDPNALNPLFGKARVLLDLGQLDSAAFYFRTVHRLEKQVYGANDPGLLIGVIMLGATFRKGCHLDSADHYISWAQQLAEGSSVTYRDRAWMLSELAFYYEWSGDPGSALQHAEGSWSTLIDETDRPSALRVAHAVVGRMLLFNGRGTEAIPHFRSILAMKRCAGCVPDNYEVTSRSLLGGALLLSGRTDTARIVIEEAVRLNGDADALWYEYLLKKVERSPDENVDALLRCWIVRRKDYNSSPFQKRTTWETLAAAAAEVDRTGELKGLEPDELPR